MSENPNMEPEQEVILPVTPTESSYTSSSPEDQATPQATPSSVHKGKGKKKLRSPTLSSPILRKKWKPNPVTPKSIEQANTFLRNGAENDTVNTYANTRCRAVAAEALQDEITYLKMVIAENLASQKDIDELMLLEAKLAFFKNPTLKHSKDTIVQTWVKADKYYVSGGKVRYAEVIDISD